MTGPREDALRAAKIARAIEALRSESADAFAAAVLAAHEADVSQSELARDLGIDRSRVSQLCARGRALRASTPTPATED